MPTDPTSSDVDSLEDDPSDSFDLDRPDRVRIGVTRGETGLEVGPPRDHPDRADVSVHPAPDASHDRVTLSVDVMAGDHGTGHADVELTVAEARAIRDGLTDAVARLPDTDDSRP